MFLRIASGVISSTGQANRRASGQSSIQGRPSLDSHDRSESRPAPSGSLYDMFVSVVHRPVSILAMR